MTEWREGDIVLVRATGWLARFVRFSHAALLWKRNESWYTMEATPRRGVAGDYPGNWQRPYIIVRPRDTHEIEGALAADIALERQGEQYGLRDWWPLLWRKIRELLGLGQARRILRIQDVICSELVSDAWFWVGVDLTPGIDIPLPDDLADADVELIGEYEGG